MAIPLLELQSITKSFGPKVANDNISLSVLPGRIHALVGENGAGKTTLMTMIAGTAQPDAGTIVFDGRAVEIANPQKASALGIGMVHQHFKLVPSLTVAANVFLAREVMTKRGTLDTAAMEREVSELSKRFGLAIDPRAKIASLSVGLRQRVEVLKALSHDTRLLILDEPTAVLTPRETDELFIVMRSLAEKGCAVVFISHKLGEVLEIADEITVIRDGRTIGTLPNAGLSQADIAQMMVGREVLLRINHTPADPGDPVLSVDDLTVIDDRGVTVLDHLSLTVCAGEIVGIAGVEGNGQSELAAAIAGMQSIDSGKFTLAGTDITTAGVAGRRAAGLAYIPEDRDAVGSGPALSVAENVVPTHLTPPIARHGWLSSRAMNAFTRDLISEFDVRDASPATPIGTLSGGNVQKVIIAREFTSNPELLLVSQPTRGVDVGAMEFVHNAIVSRRDRGAGVLLLSADLSEVMSLSDRLLVMYRGQIIAEFTQESMSEAAVGLAMAGVRPSADKVRAAEEKRARAAERVHTAVTDPGAAVTRTRAKQTATNRSSAQVNRPGRASGAAGEPTHEPLARRLGRTGRALVRGSIAPVAAVVIALLIGMVIIVALGQDPVVAYKQLLFSSFQSPQGIGALIAQFIPLAVLSAAVIISFRAGFFNIGGEGQLYIGAFAGAWAGFTFTSLPGPVVTLIALTLGLVGGMVWGMIPGALLAFWRVNIIVTTLMMSTIAILFTGYLVTGPFYDPTAGLAASRKITPDALFTMFSPEYGIGIDLLVALVAVLVLGLVLTRSVWGLKVRQLGELNRFAEYTGVNPKAMSVQVMAISGAVSGLAGAIFVLGPNGGRFLQTFSPGYGFLGITVALLARLNPWAAIVAAAFYANMMAGSNSMQVYASVPFPLVSVIQGIIILLITAVFVIDRRTRQKVLAMLHLRRPEGLSAGNAQVRGSAAADGTGSEARSDSRLERTVGPKLASGPLPQTARASDGAGAGAGEKTGDAR